MKMFVAMAALVVALLVPSAFAGGSGGQTWKDEVRLNCHRLVVNASWTRKAVLAGQERLAYNRAQRLGRTTQACRVSLSHIPGS